MKNLVFILLGLIVGFLLNDFMSKDNVSKVVTKTVYEVDTVYVTKVDTVFFTKTDIKYKEKIIKDTVYMGTNLPIRAFEASKPFLYGNVSVEGEVVGEVLKMDIMTNFKIPQVTNTITNTTTITKKPAGLYITAGSGINNFNKPFVGGVFIKDRYLVGLSTSNFMVGYRIGR